ncbi:stevor [Plasmodium reichenowi]|uniref:Stevor n=1 Tax=Plasmodium reichenowi TaxID=5854 RepID=A0A060RM69_PLARE|nr:stevor [Plasmodium reichenowi]
MNIYYLKMLLLTFLINTLILPHNIYNLNNKGRTTKISRLLAQTQNRNPHYHNDAELKEMIDKLNEEAIKKYQKTHDPYEQLQELVEHNRTITTGKHGTEPMSTIEKELLETYEEMFGEENHIILKSGMYKNDDYRTDKSSTCECTDTNNTELAKTKGKDKYLKHLKKRCTRGICSCSVLSAFLTMLGLAFAKKAALVPFASYGETSTCSSVLTLTNMLNSVTLESTLNATTGCAIGASDVALPAATAAIEALYPWGIVALVLLILAVILIIFYIWLYRRRKNSWKHECKKHLCK